MYSFVVTTPIKIREATNIISLPVSQFTNLLIRNLLIRIVREKYAVTTDQVTGVIMGEFLQRKPSYAKSDVIAGSAQISCPSLMFRAAAASRVLLGIYKLVWLGEWIAIMPGFQTYKS